MLTNFFIFPSLHLASLILTARFKGRNYKQKPLEISIDLEKGFADENFELFAENLKFIKNDRFDFLTNVLNISEHDCVVNYIYSNDINEIEMRIRFYYLKKKIFKLKNRECYRHYIPFSSSKKYVTRSKSKLANQCVPKINVTYKKLKSLKSELDFCKQELKKIKNQMILDRPLLILYVNNELISYLNVEVLAFLFFITKYKNENWKAMEKVDKYFQNLENQKNCDKSLGFQKNCDKSSGFQKNYDESSVFFYDDYFIFESLKDIKNRGITSTFEIFKELVLMFAKKGDNNTIANLQLISELQIEELFLEKNIDVITSYITRVKYDLIDMILSDKEQRCFYFLA